MNADVLAPGTRVGRWRVVDRWVRPSEYMTAPAMRVGTWRRRWPARILLAAGVLLCLVPGTPRPPPEVASAWAPEVEWETDVSLDSDPAASEQAPTPVKEQKRAPCTEGIEVELSGACWHALKQRPLVCPRLTVAYKGECFMPVLKARPVSSSMDGGMPEGR